MKKKKIEPCRLVAVANGEAIPLASVKDEAFSSGMLGCGFGLIPEDGKIFSPADGEIVGVSSALHAYNLRTSRGHDVLIHVGIETVSLGGRGFFPTVKKGTRVLSGCPIATFDPDVIKEAGLDTTIAVIVTGGEVANAKFEYGAVKGGASTVMTWDAEGKK